MYTFLFLQHHLNLFSFHIVKRLFLKLPLHNHTYFLVKQIYNFSRLRKQTINFNLTKEALENIISPEEKRPVTCELIIETVAEHFNISPDDIKSTKRNKEIAYPRQICMYLCRKMTADSLQAVGNSLGKKDHTTIIHGEKKISDDLKKDENLQNTIDVLIKKINPPK